MWTFTVGSCAGLWSWGGREGGGLPLCLHPPQAVCPGLRLHSTSPHTAPNSPPTPGPAVHPLRFAHQP